MLLTIPEVMMHCHFVIIFQLHRILCTRRLLTTLRGSSASAFSAGGDDGLLTLMAYSWTVVAPRPTGL